MHSFLNEWLAVAAYVFGLVQGLVVGWLLWRRPSLRYRGTREQIP